MTGEQLENSFKHVGWGLCWLGFWIGLGLYNFQGCSNTKETYKDVFVEKK